MMEISLDKQKAAFLNDLENSKMFSLIEDSQKTDLKNAISNSSEISLQAMMAKFHSDEKKLNELDRQIEEAEQKKKELIAKKKAFMADLAKKIEQDRIESDKAAEEALKKLDDV